MSDGRILALSSLQRYRSCANRCSPIRCRSALLYLALRNISSHLFPPAPLDSAASRSYRWTLVPLEIPDQTLTFRSTQIDIKQPHHLAPLLQPFDQLPWRALGPHFERRDVGRDLVVPPRRIDRRGEVHARFQVEQDLRDRAEYPGPAGSAECAPKGGVLEDDDG